jgi:hypothetical protein
MARSTSELRADRSLKVDAQAARKRQPDKFFKYLIVTCVLIGTVILALGGYMELVKAGKVPQPSAEGLDIFAGNAVRVAFWAALGVVVVCAAIAPVLFAIRSEDGLTIIVSIVLVVVTWSAVIFSLAERAAGGVVAKSRPVGPALASAGTLPYRAMKDPITNPQVSVAHNAALAPKISRAVHEPNGGHCRLVGDHYEVKVDSSGARPTLLKGNHFFEIKYFQNVFRWIFPTGEGSIQACPVHACSPGPFGLAASTLNFVSKETDYVFNSKQWPFLGAHDADGSKSGRIGRQRAR